MTSLKHEVTCQVCSLFNNMLLGPIVGDAKGFIVFSFQIHCQSVSLDHILEQMVSAVVDGTIASFCAGLLYESALKLLAHFYLTKLYGVFPACSQDASPGVTDITPLLFRVNKFSKLHDPCLCEESGLSSAVAKNPKTITL